MVFSSPLGSARVPFPLTPLVGRDGRVEAAWQALETTRLLTLMGPGGSGKTRLAIELASRVEDAAWVELAPLSDPRALAAYAATALGVPDRAGKPSFAHIVQRVQGRPLLLVLDNCEHIVERCAAFVAQLLRECQALKILATSREALGVAGERVVVVHPLSLPAGDVLTLEAAQASDAVALFVERARDVLAGFELTSKNAAAVSRICRRLDGIPLALELAAARMRALDPEQLAARLESSLGLLDAAGRAALPRHRTIRDTIDWSYRLLTEDERTLLRRLAVFNGTFSLDAVEAICADARERGAAALDLVTGLIDKSLLLCDAGDAGTRYRLLETVREYAGERLRDAGETDGIRERHARFFVALAERAAPAIFGGAGDEAWLARLDEEIANLREAHDWCEQQTARLELSLRLGVALHWYWYARGRFNEGRLRLGVALTFAENVASPLRGRAAAALGFLAVWQGDDAAVHPRMEEAAALLRAAGDRASAAHALSGLGIAAALQGRADDARRLVGDAALCVEDEPPGALVAWIEYWRGFAAEAGRDAERARHAYQRALILGRRLNHRTVIAHALCAIGRQAAAEGHSEAAAAALRESTAIFREVGDRWGLAFALQGMARAAAARDGTHAAALLGASDALWEDLDVELPPRLRSYRDASAAESLATAAEPAFSCAWAGARKRPLADMLAALMPDDTKTPADPAAREQPAVDLRIRALGPLEVYAGRGRVERSDWGSSRARELLVFLACHAQGCTKTQIGLSLWPDASPAQLRNVFHVTLHRLRHAIRLPDAIQVDGERYAFNRALSWELDADVFEREARAVIRAVRSGTDAAAALQTALTRYRGDFLSGETAGEWADERRERLRALRMEALGALGRAHMERARYAEAADTFSALLAADPVNEDACQRQMICLTHLGDRASALRTYDALVRALRHELGVDPARETVALRDKLAVSST